MMKRSAVVQFAQSIEGKRDEAAKALQGFLKDIGYV